MIHRWCTAAVVLGAAAVGTLALATPAAAQPAAADVTVTPSEATRGAPAELAFHVPPERAGGYPTQIELDAPEATPIAEIYPMSVDDWAPRIATRQLTRPVELIHGTTTIEVVSAITWIRVADAPADPGKPIELRVSLGPMPQADRVVFTVVQTYSDGTVVQDQASVVTLVGQATGGGHDAAHRAGAAVDGGAAGAAGGSGGTGGYRILVAGLLVGLAVGVGFDGWLIARAVRRRVV
jgi:uncharacterized protein YcnI